MGGTRCGQRGKETGLRRRAVHLRAQTRNQRADGDMPADVLKKDFGIFQKRIVIDVLTDGCQRKIAGMDITFFSLHSTKEEQYGFRAVTPEGKTVVCLGDEPLNDANRDVAQNADWLLTEAFCLHSEAERYKPYEKHHSTALDAGKTAATLHARNLIIYHTEDDSLPSRQKAYAAEAALNFSGHIVVPDDLDSVTL